MHLALLLLCTLQAAPPAAPPHIELLTVEQGPDLVRRFGHAALCVVRPGDVERSVCFNYGATVVSSAGDLVWGFLRGTARFMVILQQRDELVELYRSEDRTLWSQRLPFTPDQVERLAARMDRDLLEENRHYLYHHIDDNCATRLRDHLDHVTGGAFRQGGGQSIGVSYRELARKGLADQTTLLVLMNLGFGRRLDEQVTRWASMGHPDFLRAEVTRRLGVRPEQLHARQGPGIPQQGGWGHGWMLLLAVILALPIVLARILGRAERLAIGFAAGLLTLLAGGLWLVAVVTTTRELRFNEVLLALLPCDLLLVVLAGRARQLYARIRLGGLAVVLLLSVVGVLRQPLLFAVLIPLLPVAATVERRIGTSPTTP